MREPNPLHVAPRTHLELVIRAAIVATTTFCIIGLVWFLVLIRDILLMVLIAAIIATGISPIVAAVQRIRWNKRQVSLSRPWALLIVYAMLLLLIGIIVAGILTPVVIESEGFFTHLPDNLARLEAGLEGLRARYAWLPDLAGVVHRLPEEIGNLTKYFGPAAGIAFRFLGGLATVITVFFLSFYMLVEGPSIRAGLLALFPETSRPQVTRILRDIGLKFGGWLRGQFLLSGIIGVAAAVGMAAIGMPYPILLGIYAFIVEFIPMIGPTLSAIPAVFLALFQPWWMIVATIAWYTLIQQVEGNYLVPRVMRRTVGLSPLLTIIALVIGARLLGLVGALIAVPVATAAQVVVGEVLDAVRPKE